RTGGGGYHYIFRIPAGETVPRNSTKEIGANLDIRGEGGQVVAWPSIHKTGKLYEWLAGFAPWETDIAEAPARLLKLVLWKSGPKPGQPAQVASGQQAANDDSEQGAEYHRFLAETGLSETDVKGAVDLYIRAMPDAVEEENGSGAVFAAGRA